MGAEACAGREGGRGCTGIGAMRVFGETLGATAFAFTVAMPGWRGKAAAEADTAIEGGAAGAMGRREVETRVETGGNGCEA